MSTAVSSKQALSLEQLKELFNNPDRIAGQLNSVLLTMADPVEETRAWATDCLELVESIDSTKAAEIAPLCEHAGEFVVYWTFVMLGKSGSVDAYQSQLAHALRSHTSLVVRQAAASALRMSKQADAATKDALREAATNPDPRLSRLAQQALAEIG